MARLTEVTAQSEATMLAVMHPRTRKLIGSIALVLFVALYMVVAMEVTTIFLSGSSGLVQAVGYAVAGLIWIVPAGAIIWWMAKPSP